MQATAPTPSAKMGQNDGSMLAILAIAGFLLFNAMKGKGEPVTPVPPVPPGPPGPVTVGASVGAVNVSMRNHLVTKSPGQTIIVDVNWTPGTFNAQGGAVTWPYKVEVKLGHNTSFGWRTSGALGFSEDGEHTVSLF
ncbi:MAG: hypothetical protein Q8R28_13470, partial [Dehalococcoidia bacterium]|nr:hypothetical protein [Dehalococcoidia bacterium]